MSESGPPPEVRESTLPGIGKKYVLPLQASGNLAIIVKPDGERQLYHFLRNEDRPCDVVKLEPREAQQVANLLGKPLVSAPEKLEMALGALELEWLELPERAPVVGKTLAEIRLRSKTGASLVAIMRGESAIPNPSIDTPFAAGDTLVLIGSPAQTEAARALILG